MKLYETIKGYYFTISFNYVKTENKLAKYLTITIYCNLRKTIIQ